MKILVKFHDQPAIEIAVDDTETGRLYFDLTQRQNEQQPPFYRDTAVYTAEYMVELAYRAKDAFNWDWFSDQYDISITAQLHKDLENSVGQLGFDQIPEQYDELLYDLHHCLHAIQFGKTTQRRVDNFQIEWLVDDFLPLPDSFEFKEYSNYGDLILINPYVGHNPLQIYRENDFTSLATTCRFHDIIKPGIVITTGDPRLTKDDILAKFIEHDSEFVQLHGADKIKYYAGTAVIGHVVDIDILNQVTQSANTLVLDQIEFYE
jgi:hypothetical protein